MNLLEIREICGKCDANQYCTKTAYRVAKCEVEVLEARLAEVKKLPEKWRHVNLSNGFDDLVGHNIETTYEICADDLESVLRGAPQEEKKK